MVSIKEKGILLHIIKHCKRITSKMVGISEDSFYKDDDIQEIICFNILQIGELVKRLDADFISKYNEIPWDKIAKMRDVVAHRYGTIKIDDLYRTTIFDIEPLELYCKEIISEKNTSDNN